jgi:hypothetical protein
VILYTGNGEARQEFSIVLTVRPLAGQWAPSSESSEARSVPASEVPGYTMDRSMRNRINDYLARVKSPVVIWGRRQAAGLAGILRRWPPMSAISSSFPPSAAM